MVTRDPIKALFRPNKIRLWADPGCQSETSDGLLHIKGTF